MNDRPGFKSDFFFVTGTLVVGVKGIMVSMMY